MPSIQQKQQIIRSKIQNLRWETSKDWQKDMIEIDNQIKEYWKLYKNDNYTRYYGKNE